jgi:hypothetical protein
MVFRSEAVEQRSRSDLPHTELVCLPATPLPQGVRLKAGGDLKFLGEFQHAAASTHGVPVYGPQDSPQDHRGVVDVAGHPIEGTDQDAAVGGIPVVGDVVALEQLGGEDPAGAGAVDLDGEAAAAALIELARTN